MEITIKEGDCLTEMPKLSESSIDAIVSDPPYGLSFMGRTWDHGVPGSPFWVEALRVLKPGAHMLAFGGTRTYHRLTVAIEEAGFEIRDCLGWIRDPRLSRLDLWLRVSKVARHKQGDRQGGGERAGKNPPDPARRQANRTKGGRV